MRPRLRFTVLFALLAPLVAASVAHAQVVPTQPEIVDWNYNGLAVAAGSGCSGPGDTAFILPAENQLTVIFTGMHVGLTAGQGSNSAIKSCSIVVPAKIKQPDPTSFYYVAQLQETLQYGYVRTSLTNGKIAMASRFFNQPAGRIDVQIPTPGWPAFNAPLIERDDFSNIFVFNPGGGSCADDFAGNYVATISATATRSGQSQDIQIEVPGQDIRLSTVPIFGHKPCP